MQIPSYEEYVRSLSRLTAHVDPALDTPESLSIKRAAQSLITLPSVDLDTLATWIAEHPDDVPVLGLVIGLSREKLRNALRQHLGSSSWSRLARTRPRDVAALLDGEFGLVASLGTQREDQYTFADVLVARAGTRVHATSATTAGRLLEDRIEAIAVSLGLPYSTRTRFEGRDRRDAPCDLAVPGGGSTAQIVVAAKAFDSTGSKLSDAVREVREMAAVRKPTQFVFAVIDGIGWLSRGADLLQLYKLWERGAIDGMYTVATLDVFERDLRQAARLRRLLP